MLHCLAALVLLASAPETPHDPPAWPSRPLSLELLSSSAATAVQDTPAADERLSYTYLELGMIQLNVDDPGGFGGGSEDVDSYYLRASIELFRLFYLFGEYGYQDLDVADTHGNLITLGAGAHFELMRRLDLYGEIGWLFNDISSDFAQADDSSSGYELMVGARWMALPWSGGGLEANAGIGYLDLDSIMASDDAASIWELGARLHFVRIFSVGLLYRMMEDDDLVALNARVSF